MFNLRFAKDNLLYRLKAKTRHGTHSPFVYRLVDEVIYDCSDKKVYNELIKLNAAAVNNPVSTKLNQLIYRLAADWQPATIIELGEPLGITSNYLQKAAPDAKIYSENIIDKPDIVFINTHNAEDALNYFRQCLPKVSTVTLLIIEGIYNTEGMKQVWAKIKAEPNVTVTIDLFWIGLVYFKTGQAKEDFIIKI